MGEFILKYWIQVIFGLITSGLIFSFKCMFTQFKAFKLGMQAMLRNEIIDKYNHYSSKGYISIHGLENVTAMYTQYHALGGNGTITHLYDELKELPTKKGTD